ncbi:noncanonical pyrimidine nucleotidase, YjjG family [Desulfosporosinus fructosivorans]|uniref:Noncanonical pyrimidine nucleotidase, YjjG family n=1 Tax=Desulfosporosinus fructosivorans TaxID=2018669 RepID=A0A4Z0R178_9FIRM|nr:YjjG family noncanonical pyrimidine nucleotidase [Desulfosporosinus fructosivorans]TGE35747.1 noncanonical pyrimidine nucleotidase, YjjG family [Desulfosporosinus fructosivorans]
MGYKILLFDLDDTLLDFGAIEIDSLNKLFHQHGYSFSDELFRVYNSVNKQLWTDYENGTIALDDVLNSRFSGTLLKLGKTVDGIEWENQYRELLGNGHQLIDGALELCQSLSVSHRLFVITNGITKTQIKRLKQAGLYGFFEDIFDSQSIGFQKLSKEFFDYVIDHIKDFKIREALIIGDSLNTDIKGGLLSGIDTCWINRKSEKNSAEIQSTYTITSLAELCDICDLGRNA